MKKLKYKVKPPLIEQLQNYGRFQNFPLVNITRYSVSGEVLVTERMPRTSLFQFCSPPSSKVKVKGKDIPVQAMEAHRVARG
jgi:hypothetical protein